MKNKFAIFAIFALLISACESAPKEGKFKDDGKTIPEKHEIITLGGGCYWCVEAVFQQLDGVISSTAGYMGGHVANPSYEAVCSGSTGHIEVIQVVYDPEKISTAKLLEWFWKAHDPTNPFGQGADIGERYTSYIFYHTPEQKKIADTSKKEAQATFKKPIITTIKKADTFYVAGPEHQDYYFKNKDNNRYCPAVITPKLKKLNLEY